MARAATEVLASELAMLEEKFGGKPRTDAERRVLIRSAFASIEALTNAMMKTALPGITAKITESGQSHEKLHELFFEVCALSDLDYKITESGKLSISNCRIPFKNRVLFAIRCLAKSQSKELSPSHVEGWESFLEAIRIRNRITHPSTEHDLLVSSDEYETALSAVRWIVRCNHRAMGGSDY